MNYALLANSPRLLMEVPLKPAQGDRFQPTGFADIGAAEYSTPEGVKMLLVESAQSVANRLEKTCLDGDGPGIDSDLSGLPYVCAKLTRKDGPELMTSSLIEAHRLASPFFIKTPFGIKLANEMNYTQKGQLDWKQIYKVLFKYDPNALLHGVFLSLLYDGRVRVPRAITGFIEASNVRQVVSGGVKNSHVDPKGEIQLDTAETVEKGIYSNVPYPRVEYVGNIKAFFNVDLSLIRSYGLPEDATNLLTALSLLKIRRFLDSHLRLRTACDLDAAGPTIISKPEGFVSPSAADLLAEVKRLIPLCKGLFADPAVTVLDVPVVQKASK